MLVAVTVSAQLCNQSYIFTATPPPNGGTYQAGQTVTFCYTLTNWNSVNSTWFHGVVPSFGPGWDLSTLVPGPPPPTCGTSGGTWGWYPFSDGTSPTAIPPIGPGFFFDLDNDGNPGNNFGDFCTGAVNWQFCFTISVASGLNCIPGADLNAAVNSYGDSETGSWSIAACQGDPIALQPATAVCCSADAGQNGGATLCASGPPTDLFSLLGGTPDTGGTWSGPGGAITSGVIDPATAASGAYSYTVTDGNCSSSAVVNVVVAPPPNAGGDGSITLCASDTPVALGSLLSTPQPGGAWTFNGTPHGASFDPGVDAPGTYTYTVTGLPPCAADQAIAVINVSQPPDPGQDASIAVCNTGSATDLFLQLGGSPDAGGTWTFNGAAHGPTFIPGVDAAGPYVYALPGTAPCPGAQSTVLVSASDQPNAGSDGSITVCGSDPTFALLPLLGGGPDAGGTWSINGAPHPGLFDPATDPSGVFVYTLAAAAPCTNATAGVNVVVVQPPDAGANGSVTACTSSGPFDLLAQLAGAQPGGSWSINGLPHGNQFTPGVDPAGTYTYTLPGTAPCPADQSSVLVAVTSEPDAGADGSVVVCSIGAPVDLFQQLGGAPDPGGTWSFNGGPVDGQFDPAVDAAGAYTYTISVPPPCTGASSTVQVQLQPPPDAGIDGQVTLCSSGAPIDLAAQLGGNPTAGGSWSGPDAVANGVFDPQLMAAGTYTYTVSGIAPCPDDAAQVVVSVQDDPDAGTNGAITLCIDGAPVDLFNGLGGNPDTGGTWSGPGNVLNGVFDPATAPAGTYTYTIAGQPPCTGASSSVVVTLSVPADPGTDGALSLCSTGAAVDLFTVLGGSPDSGGTWSLNGVPHPASFDPATDASGIYTYTIPGSAGCDAVSADATMVVITQAFAGADAVITVCPEGAPVDLFNALGGVPTAGGTWSEPGGGITAGQFDPSTDAAGAWTYTVQSPAPCTSDQAQVVVSTATAIVASASTVDAVCNGVCDGYAALTVSGGAQDLDYSWSGGVAGPEDLVATGLCAGPYVVTITDANGCAVQISFTIGQPAPQAIDAIGTTAETCTGQCDGTAIVSDAEAVLFSMDGGVSWQPSPVFTGLCGGARSFTIQDASGCTATATATVLSPPPVIAAFTSDNPVDIENTEVVFVNLSAQATAFAWDFAGLGSSTEPNPSFTFPAETGGIYPVCLTATNANGCTDSTCQALVVLEELMVHVPNAFTPNDDGMNDSFAPVLNNPEFAVDYELVIFNRWGELLFESRNVGEAWDGRRGGEQVKADVYVWKLRVRDLLTRRRQELSGHVTVVR